MSTSDGKVGGVPLRSSRWQLAQLLLHADFSSRPTNRAIHGISLEFTYSRAVSGSNAAPPHSPPPSTPGKMRVPCVVGGKKIPFELSLRNAASAPACASGVRVVSMSSVMIWRVKGGGFTGYG